MGGYNVYIRILVLLLVFSMLPFTALAQDRHWAENDLEEIYCLDGIEVNEPNMPASIVLQERILSLIDLNIAPKQGLMRYWLLKTMVDQLSLPDLKDDEVITIMGEYSDYCDLCIKANLVLAKAQKSGLLRGRITQGTLVAAAREPVTNAELIVFAHRYLTLKYMNGLPKNSIGNNVMK